MEPPDPTGNQRLEFRERSDAEDKATKAALARFLERFLGGFMLAVLLMVIGLSGGHQWLFYVGLAVATLSIAYARLAK